MIDLYCERLGPGIWAEPINALTNLAFLVAAFAAWRLADQYRSLSVTTDDLAVCKYFPVGTHFFWHLFNGLLVYLAFRGLLINLTTSERRVDS